MSFEVRYNKILEEIAACCLTAGRDPREVRLVAVSKTVGLPDINEAVLAGAHDFGENRPDALEEKSRALPNETWHFIGNIQSRRISDIVTHASLVHSLYQEHHLVKLSKAAFAMDKVQDVLLEVNISGEASKSGLAPKDVAGMLEQCLKSSNIRVCGLMTMAPRGSKDIARACFDDLARLREDLCKELNEDQSRSFKELSMGMSDDWQEAVYAGATIVRIGRALFDGNSAGV